MVDQTTLRALSARLVAREQWLSAHRRRWRGLGIPLAHGELEEIESELREAAARLDELDAALDALPTQNDEEVATRMDGRTEIDAPQPASADVITRRWSCGAAATGSANMPITCPVHGKECDLVCQHGNAMDMHCCPCRRSGFFPPDDCDCYGTALTMPVWRCKACGCLWRDNLDDTASLFNAQQTSCSSCEHSPTREACAIHWLDVLIVPSVTRQDEKEHDEGVTRSAESMDLPASVSTRPPMDIVKP